MPLDFEAIDEPSPGPLWRERFERLWPHYERWYLSQGHSHRPTYLECERALKAHLPRIVPAWEALAELAGGGDLEARFLSLYCPPPYFTGCSQAAWMRDEPLLVRNYDYSPKLCEGMVWRTAWNGRPVVATSDCLVGALDGINEAGLAISLNFGGMQESGAGFGAPMVVRYLLEFCTETSEAAAVLRHVPFHMAYNILMVDAAGDYATAFTRPGGPNIVRRIAASTNHQDRVHWVRHAEATGTLERERRLFELIEDHELSEEAFIEAFLEPPLYQTKFERGIGTLYTAVYRPREGTLSLRWPKRRRTFDVSGKFERD